MAGAVEVPSHEIAGRSIVDASQEDARAGVEPAADLHVGESTRVPPQETGQPPVGPIAGTTKTVYSVSLIYRNKRWVGQAPMVHSAASANSGAAEAAE